MSTALRCAVVRLTVPTNTKKGPPLSSQNLVRGWGKTYRAYGHNEGLCCGALCQVRPIQSQESETDICQASRFQQSALWGVLSSQSNIFAEPQEGASGVALPTTYTEGAGKYRQHKSSD